MSDAKLKELADMLDELIEVVNRLDTNIEELKEDHVQILEKLNNLDVSGDGFEEYS